MPNFHAIWSAVAHIVEPLLWLLGGYVLLRLMFRLARRFHLISGLGLTGHVLPFLAAVLLALWRANLIDSWGFLTGLIQTIAMVLTMAVALHIGDRWLLRYLESEGRASSIPRLMRDIARGALLLLTFFVSISHFFHIQIGTVLLSSTVFTAVVGLALQDLLKNVFAGIALQMERPFAPGDWIFVDQTLGFGRVLEMSWRAIRVRPRDGQIVVIPNSVVAQQQINNLSASGRPLAMRLTVAVDGFHPPMLVRGLLKEAVLSSAGVLETPPPFVYVRAYTSAATTYEIKFWVATYDNYPEQQADAMSRIWYVLRRADIDFAPNEVVVTDPEKSQKQRRFAYTPDQLVTRLRRMALLDGLDDGEMEWLANNVEIRMFEKGEHLARQGEFETTLYAITRGKVRVEVVQENGEPLLVGSLGPGEVFGERGLLMGEARSANVIAEEDTRAIVIDRHDIVPLIENNPMLTERLGAILSERQSATSAHLAQAQRNLNNQAPVASAQARTISERIRRVLFDLGGN